MKNITLVITPTHDGYRQWLNTQSKYNRENTKPVVKSEQLRGVARGTDAIVLGYPNEKGFDDVLKSRQLNIMES